MEEESGEIGVMENLEQQEIDTQTTNGDPKNVIDMDTSVDINTNSPEYSSHQANGKDTDVDSIDSNECLLRLVFKDKSAFDELHQLIGNCVRDAFSLVKKSVNVTIDKSENCVKISESSEDDVFMVDTLPTDNAKESEIPDYNSSQIDMLNIGSATNDQTEADDDSKPKGNCWNCSGNHSLKDCTEKRDPAAISRAKSSFMQKNRTERYHLDSEQKYNHLVPGRISDNLRQALGLRARELPLYIYKMRLYGYPEGWLEEAKINHSGLSLFHTENASSADSNIDDGSASKVEFDASKFIEYPGFNADVPPHYIDEGDYYRAPPIQYCNSKEGLTQLLQNNLTKTYKRKRLNLDAKEEPAPAENVKDDDMDVQDSEDENTDSPVMFPQPRPASADGDETNSNTLPENAQDASCDSNQLSLIELKRKQEEILKALEDALSDSNSSPQSPEQNGEPKIVEITNETNASLLTEMNTEEQVNDVSIAETTIKTVDINESSIEQSETVLNTPTITGRSRKSVFGTPLIKQVSPFSKLPVGDKWAVGVTDVIDFENLPDATGTYQKLNGVIQKIRTKIKEINDKHEWDSS